MYRNKSSVQQTLDESRLVFSLK